MTYKKKVSLQLLYMPRLFSSKTNVSTCECGHVRAPVRIRAATAAIHQGCTCGTHRCG